MEQRYEDDITIELRELFALIWKRIPVILASALILAFSAFIATKLLITPVYTLETRVCVVTSKSTTESLQGELLEDDFSFGRTGKTYDTSNVMVLNDCAELIKSGQILNPVIEELDLNLTLQQLQGKITTEVRQDSRIISVFIESEDEEVTRQIADAIRRVSNEKLPEILEVESVVTVQEGIMSGGLSSSVIKKNMVVGAFLGVLLSVCIIVWLYIFDDKIKSVEDIERYLKLNTFGIVSADETKYDKESYRNLRTNVQFAAGLDRKVLTSINCTSNKENKVAKFLAASIAETGKKVLYINANMRESLTEEKGLSQYLAGQVELKDIITDTEEKGISIIASGISVLNSTELLDNIKLEEMLKEVRTKFDYIIVDTPPLEKAIDGVVVAGKSDAVLLIINTSVSQKNAKYMKKQLEMSGSPILGAILCDV